ncbi:hypothetical protein ACIOC2_23830 [Streptomyces sp. NPDC088337]|uniref:hypothetical protein n=1 Tax=unclassified Streptomyces TaxID=2593676 RepID=UPI002DD8BF28|nr:hypothetical protein [Streptomyces sp. NBC_01788]WSB29911.1 hypothetical protein OIE49_30700 [Streptomyces sp. NBC_01788]
MPHAVAALGAAALTTAGSVWYVPALADLRAGADRPESRRIAAAACVTGWAGAGALAVLLLIAEAWWTPVAAAAAGTVVATALRLHAAARRRREAREMADHWSHLGHVPSPTGPSHSRNVVATVLGCGLVAAVTVAAWTWHSASDPADHPRWVAAAASAAVMGVFLTAAGVYASATRPTMAVVRARQRR